MAKKSVWKTLIGLAAAGAAVGSAVAYVKRCKEVNDLSEEDFDDLFEEEGDEGSCEKPAERTYTTLPAEDSVEAEVQNTSETDANGEEADDSEADADEEEVTEE